MILHLCHHWFWITTLGVLLAMPVIVKGWEVLADPHPDLGSTNASHPTTVRTKFKAVLLNMTRLYPVPSDSVPDNSSSLTEATNSSSRRIPVGSLTNLVPIGKATPTSAESSVGLTEEQEEFSVERVDRTLFAIEPSVETRQLIASPEPIILHPASGEQPTPISPSKPTPDNSSDTREQAAESETRDLTTLGDKLPTLADTRELPALENPSSIRDLPLSDTRELPTLELPKLSATREPLSETRDLPTLYDTRELPTLSDTRELIPTLSETRKPIPTLSETRKPIPTLSETRELPKLSDTRELPTLNDTRELPTLNDTRELPTLSDTRELPTLNDTRELPTLNDTSELPTLNDTRELPKFSNIKELPNGNTSPFTTNQGERLEREIRKENATQAIDIQLHPSYEPGSDGLEHDKLSQHTQDYIKKTFPPVADSDSSSDQVKYDTEDDAGGYTLYVTPSSTSTSNDLTSPSPSFSTYPPLGAVEVVKKSDNISKIKDKPSPPDLKSKFSSKIKEKTTTTVKPTENSTWVATPEPSVAPVATVSNETVLNDSPAITQDNVTELAVDNTSLSADYEEFNQTTSSPGNKGTVTRSSAQGRMLDVAPPPSDPQAHAEANPWAGTNVAMISGISFGALALVTLLGAVSFIMYRRYRWNKPQTLSDKCSNPDSSGYIDDSTLRENSEEMYSLDNDSFLNSLEAMTIQNYWTDHVKHTKL